MSGKILKKHMVEIIKISAKRAIGILVLIRLCIHFIHIDQFRRTIFEARFKRIEIHNTEAKEGKHTFTQRINKFSDLVNPYVQ
jgi:hypothetical protein